MEKATISVIIPAYNVEDYIERCLNSIRKQSYKNLEIIIINDGSTDKTPKLCDDFVSKDSRFLVIHKENQGVSMARNDGIKAATGKYLLFFDGDDFVEPYTCEELYDLIEEKDVDMIFYGYHRYDKNKIFETCLPIFEEGTYSEKEILTTILPKFIGVSYDGINKWINKEANGLYVENPALWRTIIKAELINKNSIFFDKNLKVGEDTIFTSQCLTYAKNCYVHHKCYYYLVTRETSTIHIYEKNPLGKLDGKERLLISRKILTKDVNARINMDIEPFWQGTVVMSCIELSFLFSNKIQGLSKKERYNLFLKYAKNTDVKAISDNFMIAPKLSIKVIPFLLLKYHWYGVLFFATSCLNLINYRFERE